LKKAGSEDRLSRGIIFNGLKPERCAEKTEKEKRKKGKKKRVKEEKKMSRKEARIILPPPFFKEWYK